MKRDIILIGPVGAGKSTVGKLLSSHVNMPQASLDDKRWSIYEEIGYDYKIADKIYQEEGFLGMYKYWKPFEAYSVKRVLEIYEEHVHDFGAGQSVYEDKNLFEEVSEILKPYSNVVLLLPSPNKEESLNILFERNKFTHNDLFINNPSNEKLAKIIVYTKGKTPEETCEEIISKLKL